MAAIKFLSVDDEEQIEFLMKQYFRRKIRGGEYEFFFARNGVEGLKILHDHPDIDIILCDINMPEMDGLEMLAKVNEMQNPVLRVIMVSAYGDLENIRQAMNDGAFDFATKPIDMDDLDRTIEKAIKQIDFVRQSQKEHKKLKGLEKDLAAANEIQQFILPCVFPPFPEESDDHIALVIGDVCGKGIPAALFMAVSRTIMRSVGMQYESAGECMTKANQLLASSSVDYMFVTIFYAILNIKTGSVTYCNGGHNPPYVLRANGTVEELPTSENLIVGALKGIEFKENTLQLDHGDTLVMYTDGVPEAMKPTREVFGMKRFGNTLSGLIGKSSQEVVETVKAEVADFIGDDEQSDDITLLVVKRK